MKKGGGPNSSRLQGKIRLPPAVLRRHAPALAASGLRVQAARAEALLSRTEGHELAMRQWPTAQDEKRDFSTMATNRSKFAPKRETETAPRLPFPRPPPRSAPHQGVAENVAQAFGLIVPRIRRHPHRAHDRSQAPLAEATEDSLNDKATAMHFQRIVAGPSSHSASRGRQPLLFRKGHSGPRRHRLRRRWRRDEHTEPPSASKARRAAHPRVRS